MTGTREQVLDVPSPATSPAPAGNRVVRVRAVTDLADQVRLLELECPQGRDFTRFEPGSHIRLHLPSGLERSYSLVSSPLERDHLGVAVHLSAETRGGSREVFALDVGDRLEVSEPICDFALDADAEQHVLIAGGIGITPLWSMIRELERRGSAWQLHYAFADPRRAAFLDEAMELEWARPGRVHLYASCEQQRLDLGAVVSTVGPRTTAYCCGPDRIVDEFRAVAAGLGPRARVEDFSVAEPATHAPGGLEVRLARSDATLVVPPGTTILDAVLEQGVDVEYSCMSGTCGSCLTRVLSGVPDHQDFFLTDEEKQAGDQMLICSSGAEVGPLVLDL